jgi:hypothetical protein
VSVRETVTSPSLRDRVTSGACLKDETVSSAPLPTTKDRTSSGRCRRPASVMVGVVIAFVSAFAVGMGASGASTPPKPPATAPFTAPTSVTLADTLPPWPLPTDAKPYITAAGLPILGAEELAVHYHAHLDIVADGAKVTVPAGIGFVINNGRETGITVIHTHDKSGVIHIESASNEPYTLGQLFTEWGVALSATQLGGLHTDSTHMFAAYVNGRHFTGDPATLRLKKHLEIALWYGPSTETPKVPKSYHFPAGL